MANLRGIRDRIKSVTNTQKITKAMRLVAAAKVRRAQEQVLGARPFADKLAAAIYRLQTRLRLENLDLPLLRRREVKRVAVLVLSSDRGLCGGYNANVLRRAVGELRRLKEEGKEVLVFPVGTKAVNLFKRSNFPVGTSYNQLPQVPRAQEAVMIAERLLSAFLAEEVDSVLMVYTRFVSLIASKPTVQTLLPFDLSQLAPEDEVFRMTTRGGDFQVTRERVQIESKEIPLDMIFEQDPVQLLDTLLPLYLQGQILRALQESAASELASRMTAMSSASDNAKKLITRLTLEYNKARQASITQQIMEVVGGAEAMS
ncbi:F0F1 ATP synthase subunit gamma [Candidatus Cyanaurora vandensis]|uniref:F0F1 ATP synthase subunit gamma n=1 Tax=Candidatus Cyanaurora vandensis TaxID=2714958 RepID=UPI0025803CD4|nr:F0F1 ATP synthase subunit gamma [Candidatus Cyanaurora vandensis]